MAAIFATFRVLNGAGSPFLACSVAAAAVIHFAKRPRTVEIVVTAVLAAVLGLAYILSGGAFGQYPASGFVRTTAFLGLASMLVLGWKACGSTAALRPLLLATLCPALVILTHLALAGAHHFKLARPLSAIEPRPQPAVGRATLASFSTKPHPSHTIDTIAPASRRKFAPPR
jgi:hypothetical protein